jgi:hypothetical protein
MANVPDVNLGGKSEPRELNPHAFLENPIETFSGSLTRMNSVDRDQLADLQRVAMQLRFEQLREAIPLLERAADHASVDEITDVDDVVPLLFDHAHYKSYPASLIDKKRFGDLTRWISRLTTVDLSQVDVSGCQSLDEWLEVLDAETELRLCHSSGTSGSLSFIPWSAAEFNLLGQFRAAVYTQDFGVDEDCRETPGIHVIFPYFRSGGSILVRQNDGIATWVAKGEERFHAAFPGRLSSDVMYLAGRLRAAAARGQAHQLEVDPALLARKEEFDRLLVEMPQRIERFLLELADELAGERIFTITIWNTIHNLARAGLAKGLHGVFAPNSVLALGGGAKGLEQPAGWENEVLEFTGAERIRSGYGMSEITMSAAMCEHGRYHFNPWIVPYVLDPVTSAPLPRSGNQTGRAAFFDLACSTRWGGFITGDQITLEHDVSCPCGQTTVSCRPEITRIADLQGGEDKITCAATESAAQETFEFLATL